MSQDTVAGVVMGYRRIHTTNNGRCSGHRKMMPQAIQCLCNFTLENRHVGARAQVEIVYLVTDQTL